MSLLLRIAACWIPVVLLAVAPLWVERPAASDRVLRTSLILPATPHAVWDLWTTEAGVKSFFARGARIEPRVDGAYEIFFNPDAAPGERGADGMRILVFEPPRRLAFTWNAPPSLPTMRVQRTVVYLDLESAGDGRTRLTFTHGGWGQGREWDAAFDYFDTAWNGFVLPMLQHRIAHGPVDWSNPPKVAPAVPSLKVTLAPVR